MIGPRARRSIAFGGTLLLMAAVPGTASPQLDTQLAQLKAKIAATSSLLQSETAAETAANGQDESRLAAVEQSYKAYPAELNQLASVQQQASGALASLTQRYNTHTHKYFQTEFDKSDEKINGHMVSPINHPPHDTPYLTGGPDK